jgi:putative oxidoreductase
MSYIDKGREPKLLFPALAPFYRDFAVLSWPLIRATAGVILLVHGWGKISGGVLAGIQGFATGSLARRGIEPAFLFATIVILLETVGAICITIGLFTRPIAAALVIEFMVIIWVHAPRGFGWFTGGWEFPLFWCLIFLAIALRGGGPYSVDRNLGKEV